MLKKLSKYLKGLGWLCVASAAGMIIEALCELALPSIANSVYEMVKTASGDPSELKLKTTASRRSRRRVGSGRRTK